MTSRNALAHLAIALAWSLVGLLDPAAAYTDNQAHEIFDALDPDHYGRVTSEGFERTKVDAFFYRRSPDENTGVMKPLTFEETGLSRAFFEKVDRDHDGNIDGSK